MKKRMKRNPFFALFKDKENNMNEVRLCNMLRFHGNGQHCTVGSPLLMILNVF